MDLFTSSTNQPSAWDMTLRYPRAWSVALPAHAQEMERRALNWLRLRGIVHDAASLQKFERLAVGEYANWPFATASPAHAEIITKFLSLWIFYDDVLEEQADAQASALRSAIAGSRAPHVGDGRHLRAWAELGRACADAMSPAWLARHGQRFADWVTAVDQERAVAVERRRTGAQPRISEHLLRRRANIGMAPNLDFLEYQMGWELPPRLLADPVFVQIEQCAADIVAITNDLFGFSKDHELSWVNLVSAAMQELELTVSAAFRLVCELHDARVTTLVEAGKLLVARYQDEPQLPRWLCGLHHVVYGFARWHSRAPRYSSRHRVGSQEIRLHVLEVE